MRPTRNQDLRARLRFLAALSLLPTLGGCVAAAALAVPAMTGIGVVTRHKEAETPPATVTISDPAPPPPAPAQLAPPPPSAPQTPMPQASAPVAPATIAVDGGLQARVLPLTQLPKPGDTLPVFSAASATAWRSFFFYAMTQTRPVAGSDSRVSAILAPDSAVQMLPHRRTCKGEDSAVIIDLDPASGRFAPEAGLQAPPDLANELALLRRVGIVVMWISDLDTSRLDDIASALVSSGLDPTGKDPILLAIGEGDRKQSLRRQAGENACVVAIAGDARSDFDELFGYLRNPKAASNFDPMLGTGWFLVPESLSTATPHTPRTPGAG